MILTGRFRRAERRQRGAVIAEFAAALMLLFPLMFLICYVAVEAMQLCMIKSVLNHTAAVASRRLAVAYADDPEAAVSNPDACFSEIRFNNVVVDNRQFDVPAGTAGWDIYSNPPTVTVEVTFQGGLYGLPPFPNPDPLGLGLNLTVRSSAKANLE
ncbi:MAG: hypothetical protein AB7W16_16380 [Candidatus Obscuribacterales bacterium]